MWGSGCGRSTRPAFSRCSCPLRPSLSWEGLAASGAQLGKCLVKDCHTVLFLFFLAQLALRMKTAVQSWKQKFDNTTLSIAAAEAGNLLVMYS